MDIAIIGTIKRPDTLDAEGEIIEEGAMLAGWHVDTTEPLDGCEQWLVNPNSPVHGFYGIDECYKYTFDSKEHFESLFPPDETEMP